MILDAGKKIKRKRRKKKKKKLGLEKGEKVMRNIPEPKRVIGTYRKALSGAVRLTRTQVMEKYAALGLAQFSEQLKGLYQDMPQWKNTERVVGEVVSTANKVHQEAFAKAASEAVGFNMNRFINEQGLEPILSASIDENVEMITDLTVKSQRRVASIVNKAIMGQEGKSVDLRKELSKSLGMDAKQAKFIARDQTQRLFKNLNQFRQEKIGVEKYQWITAKDAVVRKTHKDNNKKFFRWDKPPPKTGHPGNDYNCRCFAKAVIKGFE